MSDRTTPTGGGARRLGAFAGLFLIGAETFLVSPLLPDMTHDLSVTAAAGAATITAYVLTYAVVSPFMGAIADRVGRRVPLLVGMTLFCCANVVCAVGGDLAWVIAGRSVGGLGAALAGPSIWAFLADSVVAEEISRMMGRGMAVFSAGQVIGIPIGAVLAAVAGWRWAFAALAVGSAATVALAAVQIRPPRAPAGTASVRSAFSVVGDSRVLPVLATTITTQLFSLGAYAYVGAVLHSRFGWDQAALGIVGVLVGLGSVGGSLVNGRLIAHDTGRSWRVSAWVGVMIAAVLVFANVDSPFAAVVALLVWFIGSGAFVTEQQTSLAVAAGSRRAAASAWNTSVMHAGTAVGVSVIGVFTPLTTGVTVVTVTAGAVAVALSAAAQRRRVVTERREPVAA